MVRNKLLLIGLLLSSSIVTFSNVNRYVVFLHDKDTAAFEQIDPSQFLSQRALERRQRQGIALDARDYPVNETYIQEINELGIETFYESRWMNAVLIQTDEANIDALKRLTFVDNIELVARGERLNIVGTSFTEPDNSPTSFDEQINAFQNELLGVDIMHEAGFRGEGMRVAIMDGGFTNLDEIQYFQHLFQDNRVVGTYDFVENDEYVYHHDDHGTNVAACMAALAEEVYIGVAHQAEYMFFVTEDVPTETRIEEYNWLFAAEMADSAGVDVINTSLGYYDFDDASTNYAIDDLDGETAVITRAVDFAVATGMVVVVSAGNEGNNRWRRIATPADAFNVISVGAVGQNLDRASFSSFGPSADLRLKPEVVAFGRATVTLSERGRFTNVSGTSLAAPLVAGLAVGFWQANPQLSAIDVRERIVSTAHNAITPNNEIGFGIPTFTRAQNIIVFDETSENPFDADFVLYPNPTNNDEVAIRLDGALPDGSYDVSIVNENGSLLNRMSFSRESFLNPVALDISNLTAGVYFVNIQSQGRQETIRMIKL